MTNPIKRLFQILKEIVLFPIAFLQARRAMQDIERFRRLPKNPAARRKLLAEMGIPEEMFPLFMPITPQTMNDKLIQEVDLNYLEDVEDEWDEEDEAEETDNDFND